MLSFARKFQTRYGKLFQIDGWWPLWKSYLTTQAELVEPARLRVTLTKLVLLRICILTALLSTSAWALLASGTASRSINYNLSFWIIGCTYAISLVNIYLVRKAERLLELGYLQFLVDVALVSAAIYISGGPTSPFVVLFLVVIVGAAVVLNREGAVIIAAAAGLSYAVIAGDVLPRVSPDFVSASAQHILGVYVSLVLIALVAGYLAKQLETLWGVNSRQAKDLSELTNQQRQLFEDISEGIIIVDLQGHISVINRAAADLLHFDQSELSKLNGRSLPQLLSARGSGDFSRLLERTGTTEEAREFSLKESNTEREVCLRYKVRPLTNAVGREVGRILIFNDVSHIRTIEQRLSLHEEWTKLMAQGDKEQTGERVGAARALMVGESLVMRQVVALCERVAASEATVLITGESGTGKELISKGIHLGSSRASKPFVAINCGAIPENLIESELFGHKRGSFTGANSDKPGLFRQANGGTIFLDEVGELHPLMQTKLLRVLQEKRIRPVGEVTDFGVDVRVISATNRDLKKEIATGGFREDLYYRLNVVNIAVPPLRERREDIPLLVRYFISRYADPAKVLPQLSPEALQILTSYNYPGNIRELENIIERAIVLGGQAILPEHLAEEIKGNPSGRNPDSEGHFLPQPETNILVLPLDLEGELARIETKYLLQALEASGGLKKQAAELLGLNFRSFRYRLKKYGMAGEGLGD